MSDTPEGFNPIFRTSPYLELLGPIFNKKIENALIIGLRAEEKHCNARGLVHGGVFSSLADVALGYNAAWKFCNKAVFRKNPDLVATELHRATSSGSPLLQAAV